MITLETVNPSYEWENTINIYINYSYIVYNAAHYTVNDQYRAVIVCKNYLLVWQH